MSSLARNSDDGAIGAVLAVAGVVGAAAGAYHGYKRNESVGWACAWGFFGAVAPIIALPIAFAQGFGVKQ